MAKYGSASLLVNFDNAGGTPVDMTPYVTDINGFDIEALMEESTPVGQAWQQSLATGSYKVAPIVLGGFYDDAATSGPHAIFGTLPTGPSATSRTLTLTWGGSKTTSVECFIKVYKRTPKRNGVTRYEVTLEPTGAVTEV